MIWNPKTWFNKFTEGPFLWVLTNPARPHISLLTFSDAPESPWANGIRLTGIGTDGIPSIYGKILDWDKFSTEVQEQIKTGYVDLPVKQALALARPTITSEGG